MWYILAGYMTLWGRRIQFNLHSLLLLCFLLLSSFLLVSSIFFYLVWEISEGQDLPVVTQISRTKSKHLVSIYPIDIFFVLQMLSIKLVIYIACTKCCGFLGFIIIYIYICIIYIIYNYKYIYNYIYIYIF